MTAVIYPHIEVDAQGVARFAGTRFKIVHVILETTAWGLSPEEIHEGHPDLSLGQIHAALAYYYDHTDEINAQIEHSRREYERLRSETENLPAQQRLREMKQHRKS
ncbi:MAG: DUF433 domain-containing protein [Planctomycetes bacterium]|nr:DUF433 domain-containing protein [Planctomycetota bacterium]